MWITWLPENMSASTIDLTIIPGDGIWPRGREALKVLEKAAAAEDRLQQNSSSWGTTWLKIGRPYPAPPYARSRTRDAVLFGAIDAAPGDTHIPYGIIERRAPAEAALQPGPLRRPARSRLLRGVGSPLANPADRFHRGPRGRRRSLRGATASRPCAPAPPTSRHRGLAERGPRRRRVRPRYVPPGQRNAPAEAHARAQARRPGLRQPLSEAHGRSRGRGISRGHPRLPTRDAATIFMVTDPARFDVPIVTDDLFGDILRTSRRR